MEKYITLTLTTLFLAVPVYASALVDVDGYYRDDGTYVESHYRTDPDGIKFNNRSYNPSYNTSISSSVTVQTARYYDSCEEIYEEYRDEYEEISDKYDEKISNSGGRNAPTYAIRGEQAQLRSEKNRKLRYLDTDYNDEARDCVEDAREEKQKEKKNRLREQKEQIKTQKLQKRALDQVLYWYNGNSAYDSDELAKLQEKLGADSTKELVNYLSNNILKDKYAEQILEKLSSDQNKSDEEKTEVSSESSTSKDKNGTKKEQLRNRIDKLSDIVDSLRSKLEGEIDKQDNKEVNKITNADCRRNDGSGVAKLNEEGDGCVCPDSHHWVESKNSCVVDPNPSMEDMGLE